jgi:ATP-dependent DNA ligase
MINLFKKDAKGVMNIWSMYSFEDTIYMQWGKLGGTMQEKEECIEEGKGGRTIEQQIESRIKSRINSKISKGYKATMELASSGRSTNELGLPMPMLAVKLKDITLPNEFYIQNKFDGNRCMIVNRGESLIAYSRNGKEIHSIDHIKEGLVGKLPEGAIIDGELYIHKMPLPKIRSLVSKKQPDSLKLNYVVYDLVLDESYRERLERLKNMNLSYPIGLAKTTLITPLELELKGINTRLKEAISKGFEGLIARVPNSKYEDGKRSKGLVKIKAWDDAEFRCVGMTPSEDGWAIITCITDKGVQFRASAPGSMEEKYQVLKNKMDYIGKRVNVQFAYYTKDGVPFHPIANYWMED